MIDSSELQRGVGKVDSTREWERGKQIEVRSCMDSYVGEASKCRQEIAISRIGELPLARVDPGRKSILLLFLSYFALYF